MHAVILAAGHSTRMGHPKALTRVGDELALDRVLRVLASVGIGEPVVVLGDAHDAILAAFPLLKARVVRNRDPDAGRTGSLQRGLAATPAREIVVWPIDHPLSQASTVRALLAARGAWVVPEHAGRGGHPILLRDVALDAAMAAPPSVPLRDALRGAGVEAVRVRVEDVGVLANLDAPEDIPRS